MESAEVWEETRFAPHIGKGGMGLDGMGDGAESVQQVSLIVHLIVVSSLLAAS